MGLRQLYCQIVADQNCVQKLWEIPNSTNVALTIKYTVCFIVQITILILVQFFGCIY